MDEERKLKSSFYRVNDIKQILDVSESKAYKIIQTLNKELKEMGYIGFTTE